MRRPTPPIFEDPLKGWVSLSGILQPGGSVADYAIRLQRVLGSCHDEFCRRRVTIDCTELRRKGLGQVMMYQVKKLAVCNHIDGCTLQFHDEKPDNPLTLRHLLGRSNVRLRVACQGKDCKHFRIWRVEEMIAGLKEHDRGGDYTDVTALGGLLKAPCPTCKGERWRVEILMADRDSATWRTQGERYFDLLPPPSQPRP